MQQDALDAAWGAITSEPGYDLTCATGDAPLRLATVMQALVMLDAVNDGSAATRARLQAQGVSSVQLGKIAETYSGKDACLHPKVNQALAPYRGATVR
jgi:hypothetical protein